MATIRATASMRVPWLPSNGKPGTDAVEVEIADMPLIFDTTDNGTVLPSDSKVARVYIRQGGNDIADMVADVQALQGSNIQGYPTLKKGADNKGKYIAVTITGANIMPETTGSGTISKTGGYAVIEFTYNGTKYSRQILFQVNVSKFMQQLTSTNKVFEQHFTEIDEELNQYDSKITQTARRISLSVAEGKIEGRNLLQNSDFSRNGYITKSNAGIERLGGYDGTNAMHLVATNASPASLRWGANAATKNIGIQQGKEYTISMFAKVSDTSNAKVMLSVLNQAAETGNQAAGTALLNKTVAFGAADTWQLVQYTFTADQNYAFASVSVMLSTNSSAKMEAYISRPMLDESAEYNGYSLSPLDDTYTFGNIFDNSRYLVKGGNLYNVGLVGTGGKDGCNTARATVTAQTSKVLVLFYATNLKADTDYVLSFLTRTSDATSSRNLTANIQLVENVQFAESSNGKISNYSASAGNTTQSGYMEIGGIATEWTRVWHHFRLVNDTASQYIAVSANGKTGTGTMFLCQPKLEEAVDATPWTDAQSDLVDKKKLKDANIDIESGMITLTADKTVIDGNLHLRGVLVENYEDVATDDDFVVCDMQQHKSVSVQKARILLPMINDTTVTDSNDKTYTVKALQESGVKLTIAAKYEPSVAKWAQTTPDLYSSYRNYETGRGLMGVYHSCATMVFADPRIASKSNYTYNANADTGLVATILPEGGGGFGTAQYRGGVFVCNGRRGRMLMLMPGQTLHLTSAKETINGEEVLLWYVDNGSEFEPLTKNVIFYEDILHEGTSYECSLMSNGGSAFPMEVSTSSGSEYQDAIFGSPVINQDGLNSDLWKPVYAVQEALY